MHRHWFGGHAHNIFDKMKPPRAQLSVNTLIASWRAATHRVACSLTPCIVTSPPDGLTALVNPANERLQGTQFTPDECSRRLPGGLAGIIYPPQVVDGLVSELGGPAMAAALEEAVGCATGSSVVTPATGELTACFTHIVHTVAPFYGDEQWRERLMSAYVAAWDASCTAGLAGLAVPLLGAGARGAPPAEAAAVAADVAASWRAPVGAPPALLHFCVQDEQVAQSLTEHLDRTLGCREETSQLRGGSSQCLLC